jgi:hypothetical protein
MPRMSQDMVVGTAAAVSLALTAGAAAEIGVQAGREAFGTTLEEHNAQVEACAAELGEKAVRKVGVPEACQPFKTGFAFHGQWVTVRMPTHTGGLPSYESWQRNVFDRPSADAFEEAKLEPITPEEREEESRRPIIAALEGGLSAFGLAFSAAGAAAFLRVGASRRKAAEE